MKIDGDKVNGNEYDSIQIVNNESLHSNCPLEE